MEFSVKSLIKAAIVEPDQIDQKFDDQSCRPLRSRQAFMAVD